MKKTTLSLLLCSALMLPTLSNAATFKTQVNPLHYASSIGEIDYISKLIEDDPSLISQFNEKGQTPIHIAIEKNKIAALKKILSFNANPNIKDGNGTPALIYAIKLKNANAVKALLSADANKTVVDSSNKDAIFYAKKSSQSIKNIFFPKKEIKKTVKNQTTSGVSKKEIEKMIKKSETLIENKLKELKNDKTKDLNKKEITALKKQIEQNSKKTDKNKEDLNLTDLNILELEKTIDNQNEDIKSLKNETIVLKKENKILSSTIKSILEEIKDIQEKQLLGIYSNNSYYKNKKEEDPIVEMVGGKEIKENVETMINLPTNDIKDERTIEKNDDSLIINIEKNKNSINI